MELPKCGYHSMVPYQVSHLLAGKSIPVTCHLKSTASEALSLMRDRDFTQLPVVDAKDCFVGLVTIESILRSVIEFEKFPCEFGVADCMEWKPKTRKLEEDAADAISDLQQFGSVVIIDDEKKVIGIITDYDAAGYFRSKSEDILLIEDIETTLRQLALLPFQNRDGSRDDAGLARAISHATAPDTDLQRFKAAISSYLQGSGGQLPVDSEKLDAAFAVLVKPKEGERHVTDLTLSEITKLWLDESRWIQFSPVVGLKREDVRRMLDKIRRIRNKVFHFRGDVSKEESQSLRSCRDWLQGHLQQLIPTFGEPEEQIEMSIASQIERIDEVRKELAVGDSDEGHQDVPESGDIESFKVSKYAYLGRWLRGIPQHVQTTWITFEKIEHLIDSVLPKSALVHRSWWSNDWNSHSHAKLWLEEGWETDIVDLDRERVRFRRMNETN